MKAATSFPLVIASLLWHGSCAHESQLLRRTLLDNEDYQGKDGFGLKSTKDVPSIEMRIVGGTDADADDYPWHVRLNGCGGSLIAPDVVLTAAHCSPTGPTLALIGGSTFITGTPRIIQKGSDTIHPNYRSGSGAQDHDLMLYKLTQPVTNKAFAVLNSDEKSPSGSDVLTVLGFGNTQENGSKSFHLQKVNVSYVPHGRCNFAYWGRVKKDSMFCAGVDGGGKDSCQGDSGGPIVNRDGVLVGVTSWGNGCGRPGLPGVYARISNDLDWIQGHACRLSDSPPDYCEGVEIPEEPSVPGSSSEGGGFLDWLSSITSGGGPTWVLPNYGAN